MEDLEKLKRDMLLRQSKRSGAQETILRLTKVMDARKGNPIAMLDAFMDESLTIMDEINAAIDKDIETLKKATDEI